MMKILKAVGDTLLGWGKATISIFEYYYLYIALTLGLLLIVIGHFFPEYFTPANAQLILTLGSTILTSGIFAGVAKSGQFLGIYEKMLTKVLADNQAVILAEYSKAVGSLLHENQQQILQSHRNGLKAVLDQNQEEYLARAEGCMQRVLSEREKFLGDRQELDNFWENITRQLCQQKFNSIHGNLIDNVKKYHLPLIHDFYYDYVTITADIVYTDDPDYIKVIETQQTTLIPDDASREIKYSFSSNIPYDPVEKDKTRYEIDLLRINGDEYDTARLIQSDDEKGNKLFSRFETMLKGEKKYDIVRKTTKTYKLSLNRDKRLLAVWLYNNCKITLHYPKGLKVDFFAIGVLDDWEVTDMPQFQRIEAEYAGLIYKNQGFMFYLS